MVTWSQTYGNATPLLKLSDSSHSFLSWFVSVHRPSESGQMSPIPVPPVAKATSSDVIVPRGATFNPANNHKHVTQKRQAIEHSRAIEGNRCVSFHFGDSSFCFNCTGYCFCLIVHHSDSGKKSSPEVHQGKDKYSTACWDKADRQHSDRPRPTI